MTANSGTPAPSGQVMSSRARFISDLDGRISALRQGLSRVGHSGHDLDELNAIKRRVHALAAAADVLDFAAAAEALGQAEAALVAAGSAPMTPVAIERVARILDALPTLVLGGSVSLSHELDSESHRPLRPPFTLLLFGSAALARALGEAGPLQDADCHETSTPEQLLTIQQSLGPDAVLIDGDRCPDTGLIEQVVRASGAGSLPIVVVCSFADPKIPRAMLRAGASRVLAHPVEPWVLQRTLRQACVSHRLPATQFSDFERLSPQQLVQAIAREARLALVEALPPHARNQSLKFQSGAPVLGSLWTALAKIRALASEADPGLQFTPTGPSGSIPITPSAGQTPLSVSRNPAHETVSLEGRRVLVVHPNEGLRNDLQGLLGHLGITVSLSKSLPEAQASAHHQWPDAIVCGPQEPNFEPLELAHALEQDIALSDVPVLLVTHPLTSDLSEADSIGPFLREALVQRSQLELRLDAMTEVHGRVDGMTPRLLLELASRYQPNCTISLRSASLSFEVRLQEGQLAFASLHRDTREAGRGEDVLGPLLGTRTGRFRVVGYPATEAAQARGSLYETLAPTIDRARRARHCLSAGEVGDVTRLQLDASVVAQYLTECPRPVRGILMRLTDGVAPRQLRERALSVADTSYLQVTLEELCRRGAIAAVFDDTGRDRLADNPLFEPPVSEPRRTPLLPSGGRLIRNSSPEGSSDIDLSQAVLQAVSEASPPLLLSGSEQVPGMSQQLAGQNSPSPAEVDADQGKPPQPHGTVRQRHAKAEITDTPDSRRGDLDSSSHASTKSVSPHAKAARSAWQGGSEQATGTEPNSASWQRKLGVPIAIIAASALAVVALSQLVLPRLGLQPLFPTTAKVVPSFHLPAVELPAASTTASKPEDLAPNRTTSSAVPQVHPPSSSMIPADISGSEVAFVAELLPLPIGSKLLPGHGLLEIHSWKRQRISVDGVFMGNYKSRLVPLRPGTYELRLGSHAHGYRHTVDVKAEARIRVVAKLTSSP